MIDFEDLQIRGEGGPAQGEAIHSCADDDILAHPACDGRLERILAIVGAKDHGSIRRIGTHGRVEQRLGRRRGDSPGASRWFEAGQDQFDQRIALGPTGQAVTPGIIDEPARSRRV